MSDIVLLSGRTNSTTSSIYDSLEDAGHKVTIETNFRGATESKNKVQADCLIFELKENTPHALEFLNVLIKNELWEIPAKIAIKSRGTDPAQLAMCLDNGVDLFIQEDSHNLEIEAAVRSCVKTSNKTAITSHKYLLLEDENKVENALRGTGVGLWDWNLESGEFVLNKLWHEVLGYSKEDVPDDLDIWEHFAHPDDIEEARGKLLRHIKGKTPYYEAEYRMKAKSGRWKWILDRGKVTSKDKDGTALQVTGTHLLITDRVKAEKKLRLLNKELENIVKERTEHLEDNISRLKRAERTLSRNERKFRSIFDHSSIGIAFINDSGDFIDANKALRELLGYTKKELSEMNLVKSFVDNEERTLKRLIRTKLKKGTDCKFDCEYKKNNGETAHCSTIINHAPEATNKGHYIAIIEDKSDQQKNIELHEDIERITRHDLKTPLSGMIAVPELLRQTGGLSVIQLNLIQLLEDSATTMLNMINMSMDIYKMEKNTYKLTPSLVDILMLIRRIDIELSRVFKYKSISVETRVNGTPVTDKSSFVIWGEELLCYSMLSNLIKNALEASPESSTVTIALESDNDYYIEITNQGTVPESIRDTFFEKYTTSGKNRGTGLGTYSAKLIAETHNGHLEMKTSNKEGTTITVILPKPEETPETICTQQ